MLDEDIMSYRRHSTSNFFEERCAAIRDGKGKTHEAIDMRALVGIYYGPKSIKNCSRPQKGENFESHEFCTIIKTTKYPGLAQLVAHVIWERAGLIHEGKSVSPQRAETLAEAGTSSAKPLVKKRR